MNKLIKFASMMSLMLLVSGCGLLYDCEEAETEVANLSADFVTNPVMATCNPYLDKVNEYVDEGCGDAADAGMNCSEWVCLVQGADLAANQAIMALSAAEMVPGVPNVFADSLEYCTYYDSVAINMQNMVDAGGCVESVDGYSFSQADVDAYVESGCDYASDDSDETYRGGDSFFPFEKVSKEEIFNNIENKVSILPEEFASKIMNKLRNNIK